MNIPKTDNLHSQTLNSKFIEFVWQFEGDRTNQIIFKVHNDGATLLKEGYINAAGDFDDDKSYMTSGVISTRNLSISELNALKGEVVEYLK